MKWDSCIFAFGEASRGMVKKNAVGGSETPAVLSSGEIRRLFTKVFRFLRAKELSHEDAEDLASESVLEASRNLTTFDGRAHLDTWVIGIAKKRFLRFLRDGYRLKRAGTELSLDDEQPLHHDRLRSKIDPEREITAREQLEDVTAALGRMPELQQQALVLTVRGQSYAEVAELLQTDLTQVSSLVHQARQKLRKAFPDGAPRPSS